MNDADLRTIKLAAPAVTDEALTRFLKYQRALLDQGVAQANATGWEGRMAFAHAAALRESGMGASELGPLSAVCADFCAKRWAARELAGRREEAERHVAQAKRKGVAVPEREFEVLEAIEKERPRLEDLRPLEQRYGAEAVALLKAREDELLELHRALATASGGGHLHRS
jgi:hypothetical protein